MKKPKKQYKRDAAQFAADQRRLRDVVYDRLEEDTQSELELELEVAVRLDEKFHEWLEEREEEAKHKIRIYLRTGVQAINILAAMDRVPHKWYANDLNGFDLKQLLEDILREDEFIKFSKNGNAKAPRR